MGESRFPSCHFTSRKFNRRLVTPISDACIRFPGNNSNHQFASKPAIQRATATGAGSAPLRPSRILELELAK